MSETKQFTPIKSGNLVEAHHDGADKMQLKFKSGGLYEYEGVSPELYKEFEATFDTDDSSGKFFHSKLKGFKFKKL